MYKNVFNRYSLTAIALSFFSVKFTGAETRQTYHVVNHINVSLAHTSISSSHNYNS